MPARLSLTCVLIVFVGAASAFAAKPAIEFPDLDGWVKNTRYDPPAVPATSVAYSKKEKVGKGYVHCQVTVPTTGGKSLKEMLPSLEKAILENPVHQETTKTGSEQIKITDKTTVTRVTFTSKFSNKPTEWELYVIPYGEYVIAVERSGPAPDAAACSAETRKLVAALVAAAEK